MILFSNKNIWYRVYISRPSAFLTSRFKKKELAFAFETPNLFLHKKKYRLVCDDFHVDGLCSDSCPVKGFC